VQGSRGELPTPPKDVSCLAGFTTSPSDPGRRLMFSYASLA